MTAPKHLSLCEQSEKYYYDYLFNKRTGSIPIPVIEHIKQCSYCQEQIYLLSLALMSEGTSDDSDDHATSDMKDLLKMHFAYIGKKVTCRIARPFLPLFLEPELKISIPTPITVHLDNCRQCVADLEKITKLKLTPRQLFRLSQLFAEKTVDGDVTCLEAQTAIFASTSMVFQETNEQILKHLCICPDCREDLYKYRQVILEEYLKEEGHKECSICNRVSLSDFFDFVIPYGIESTTEQYSEFDDSIGTHFRSCPACLAKMQKLHRDLYSIAERPESEVVTIYKVDGTAEVEERNEKKSLYAGFPINVQTEQPVGESGLTNSVSSALRRKGKELKVRQLLTGGVAVMAVFFVAAALFFNITSAQALDIAKIYNAFEKMKNVHISSYIPDRAEPVQEQWFSRSLNVYISSSAEGLALWNIATKERRIKQPGSGFVEVAQASDSYINVLEKQLNSSLGVMPFDNISDIPPDARWKQITDGEQFTAIEGAEIYELTWFDNVYYRVLIFADAQTHIPQRIETFQKLQTEDEYTLRLVFVIENIDEEKVETLISKI